MIHPECSRSDANRGNVSNRVSSIFVLVPILRIYLSFTDYGSCTTFFVSSLTEQKSLRRRTSVAANGNSENNRETVKQDQKSYAIRNSRRKIYFVTDDLDTTVIS